MRVGASAEHHTEDGSARDQKPRTAEDGAGNCQRRDDDQNDSDDEPGAPLSTTSLGGRHDVRLGLVVVGSDATRSLEETAATTIDDPCEPPRRAIARSAGWPGSASTPSQLTA